MSDDVKNKPKQDYSTRNMRSPARVAAARRNLKKANAAKKTGLDKPLSDKEKSFVKAYLVDLCQTQAAIRAGYNPKTANRVGINVINRPHVREAIKKQIKKRHDKWETTADNVVRDLADIAHLDRSAVWRVVNGRLQISDSDLIPARVRRCISQISQGRDGGIRIKFDDRLKALELLGRHLALFTDNLSVSGTLKTNSIEEMTEAEIDAELARIEEKKAATGKAASESADKPT